MGQVISIKDASRGVAGDSAVLFIDECYGKLAALPGFSIRPGQKELSYAVCQALVANEPLAAEAPTGTGKTIAYLVGAVAAAEKLRTLKDIPIVVATANVGLQAQILNGDLPKLVQAGILAPTDSIVAKGRGRYFCPSNAERLAEGRSASSQVDFFNEEQNTEFQDLAEVNEMLEAWRGHKWSGDVDHYPGKKANQWVQIAASSETCLGHKCDHYNSCAFFNARRAMSSARVIIANQDLVLADLSMAKAGQDPLFPGGQYLAIFDEAHHLPNKALEAGGAALAFQAVIDELPKVTAFGKMWERNIDFAKLLAKQKIDVRDFDSSALVQSLIVLQEECGKLPFEAGQETLRFEGGKLPRDLVAPLKLAHTQSALLMDSLQDSTRALKQSNLADKNDALKVLVGETLYLAAGVNALLSTVVKALSLMHAGERSVRWLSHAKGVLTLHTSPLEGASVLEDLLWSEDRARPIFVSATLQDFVGFERFQARCGAPANLRTIALDPIFPYRENKMYLVEMANTPRLADGDSFQQELQDTLPRFIDENEGTLILFPSKTMMQKTLPALRAAFPRKLLVQNEMGIKDLVETHKSRIDAGTGSILCGLATLAEGLDLPGAYCTHVVICKLPFAVPTSPVEQELQEHLGRDYFEKSMLPDTLVKLIQMTGRLMRRESDRGRITIFDKRLKYTKWGQKLLRALPPFKRQAIQPHSPPPKGGGLPGPSALLASA